MPAETPPLIVQIYLILLFLGGLAASGHFFFVSKIPKRISPDTAVSGWQLNAPDFFVGLFGAVLLLLGLQLGLAHLLNIAGGSETPRDIILLGSATHLGALALLFAFSRANPEKFQEPFSRIKLSWPRALKYGGYAFLAILPIIYSAAYLWQLSLEMLGFPPAPQDTVLMFAEIDELPVLLLLVALTVLIAPVSEEFVFRGCIYRFLKDKIGIAGGLVISGIFFGMLHQSLSTFLPLFLLGVALAYSYEKTGSLKVPILFHAFFNANTVLILLLSEMP